MSTIFHTIYLYNYPIGPPEWPVGLLSLFYDKYTDFLGGADIT